MKLNKIDHLTSVYIRDPDHNLIEIATYQLDISGIGIFKL
jgi:hypothetical protein